MVQRLFKISYVPFHFWIFSGAVVTLVMYQAHRALGVTLPGIRRSSKDRLDECECRTAVQRKIDRKFARLALEEVRFDQGAREEREYSRFGLFEL